MRKYIIIASVGISVGILLSVTFLMMRDEMSARKPEFTRLAFDDLKGWSTDRQSQALGAFIKSCAVFLSLSPDTEITPQRLAGTAGNWQPSCRMAAKLELSRDSQEQDKQARAFFEQYFIPVGYSDNEEGLFTGYFAPEYPGNDRPTAEYAYPLYGLPGGLKILDLGKFSPELAGKSIIGEVVEGEFIPYKDRKNIENGALSDRRLELVWLKDPVDAFFMHIQGSGVIRYENGDRRGFGYAGKNGRTYRAIGRFLIDDGQIAAQDMSMQAIRDWMRKHPVRARALMWKNPSYVFFRPMTGDRPVGTMNVPLTAGRSLAVDRTHIPLGLPIWLDLQPTTPTADPIRRLMVSQDTGGAIKGRVRADIYWGVGADAGLMAGDMKDRGHYYFLLPRKLAQKILAERS